MFQFNRTHHKIGLFTAMSFAIGAMIGGGVFVLTGVALKETGPSALLSFVIAGAIVALSALSFAAIAAHADQDESGYAAVGKLLGSPFWGFLTSWCFYLGGIIGAAFVLHAFGVYMNSFINPHVTVLMWSLIGAITLTLVNLGPTSAIGRLEGLLVIGKVFILLALIVAGIVHIQATDFHPFLSAGMDGLFTASSSLFIAFLGFNVVTSISSDIDRPEKTVPRAIIYSMGVVTVLYLGVVLAMLAAHISSYDESSVGQAAIMLIGPLGGGLVIIGALVATLSAANANILGSSEIIVRLAARKQIPSILGHLFHGHPYVGVGFGAIGYIVLLLIHQTASIINLANMTAIVALVIVNIAALRLAQRRRGLILPILAITGVVSQLFFLPPTDIMIGLILVVCGGAIYAVRDRFFVAYMHRGLMAAIRIGESPLVHALKRRP